MHPDTVIVVLSAIMLLTGWLPTYVIMRRRLISERTAHKQELWNMDENAFELGRIAGRDEERRAHMQVKLNARRLNFPNS